MNRDNTQADMVSFARKHKGWHTYAIDPLTIKHLSANVHAGLLKVNQYRQFAIREVS